MTEPTADSAGAVRRLREIGLDQSTASAIVDLLRRGPDPTGPATKDDLSTFRLDQQAQRLEISAELRSLERRLGERLKVQTLAVLGGVAALLAITATIIKLM
jgi:hypothetical protein